MINDTTATTTKKTQAAKVEPEVKVKKERKVKEFKPTHYIVIPLKNIEGIYRVKWGVETNQTELVEADSAFDAVQKTNHPPKLGEGFCAFLASMNDMISGSLTIIQLDQKTKEYKITFESVKPKFVEPIVELATKATTDD
jgi:hypothetical protein